MNELSNELITSKTSSRSLYLGRLVCCFSWMAMISSRMESNCSFTAILQQFISESAGSIRNVKPHKLIPRKKEIYSFVSKANLDLSCPGYR